MFSAKSPPPACRQPRRGETRLTLPAFESERPERAGKSSLIPTHGGTDQREAGASNRRPGPCGAYTSEKGRLWPHAGTHPDSHHSPGQRALPCHTCPRWHRGLNRSPTFLPAAPALVFLVSGTPATHRISWTRPWEPPPSLTRSLPSPGPTGSLLSPRTGSLSLPWPGVTPATSLALAQTTTAAWLPASALASLLPSPNLKFLAS